MAYDMLVKARPDKETTDMALSLGWKGLCIMQNEGYKAMRHDQKSGLDLVNAILVKPQRASDAQKLVAKYRSSFDIICATGGTPEVNRSIMETGGIDMILINFGEGMRISQADAKLAKENGIMVCFPFSDLLFSYSKTRSTALTSMMEVANVAVKARAPVCVTSGASSGWDLRSPSDLLSFASLIGVPTPAAKKGMSGERVHLNRGKLSGKVVYRGVEIVK